MSVIVQIKTEMKKLASLELRRTYKGRLAIV